MAEQEDSIDRLAAQAAAMQLGSETAPSPPPSWGLRLRIPNPFEAFTSAGQEDEEKYSEPDEVMGTASPQPPSPVQQRVATAPALPQPPRYKGLTMKDRRKFMADYETYLAAINALQTQWAGVLVMPVGTCIEGRTKRRIARFTFACAPHLVTEQQRIDYFKEAYSPSHVDYGAIDQLMKALSMNTTLPEPESRMTTLQADLEAILDEFNVTELAFEREQRRLVTYLHNAMAPPAFKSVITTRPSLQENKQYKKEVVPFCTWATYLLKEYMMWERATLTYGLPQAGRSTGGTNRGNSSGRVGRTNSGTSSQGNGGTRTGGARTGGGNESGGRNGREGRGGGNTRSSVSSADGPGHSSSPGIPITPGPCLKCGSTAHQVRECNQLSSPAEAAQLLKEMRDRRRSGQTGMRKIGLSDNPPKLDDDPGTVEASVDGVTVSALLLDSGVDASLVACGVLDALRNKGINVDVSSIPPKSLTPVGGKQLSVSRVAVFKEVELATSAESLMLRNLSCYVEEDNPTLDLTVGRPIMQVLGYSTDELLVRARGAQQEWHLEHTEGAVSGADSEPTALGRVCRLQASALAPPPTALDDDVERYESRPATPTLAMKTLDDVIAILEKRMKDAVTAGLRKDLQPRLREILHVRLDSFRLDFGNDPPVKVAPLQVRLKPGVAPTRAHARRAPPLDREFLERHVGKLLAAGLVFRNSRSRRASAPRIVCKKEQDTDPTTDSRMTVDTRAVNDRTEAMPWPMPILEIIIGELEDATVFFSLDWFRGYWQLPLHPDSQEYFTFVTHRGMYTPTRVPMGATDSVAYCQAVVEESFGDLLGNGLLWWLDDILGYAKDADALLVLLDQVLERCEKYGLKLHAKKCHFYAVEIQWCGKMISVERVRHCPDRI